MSSNDPRPVITTVEELKQWVGKETGLSGWQTITQELVDTFADATDDHQYIHVDPERAKKTFFGGTVAHGYLTLSMSHPPADPPVGIRIDLGGKMVVNYGLNRVRFPAPVLVGSRVRQRTVLAKVEEIGEQAVQITSERTIEIEGSDRPACVAESLTRIYF